MSDSKRHTNPERGFFRQLLQAGPESLTVEGDKLRLAKLFAVCTASFYGLVGCAYLVWDSGWLSAVAFACAAIVAATTILASRLRPEQAFRWLLVSFLGSVSMLEVVTANDFLLALIALFPLLTALLLPNEFPRWSSASALTLVVLLCARQLGFSEPQLWNATSAPVLYVVAVGFFVVSWIYSRSLIEHVNNVRASAVHEVFRERDSSEMRAIFLANVSHELLTPISVISGYCDLMLQPVDRAELDAHVEVVLRNVHQLRDLVDELLGVTKVEAGELVIEYRRVNLRTFLKNLGSSMLPRANALHVDLKVLCQSSLPKWVFMDPRRVGQVLRYLIDSSIRASPDGECRVEFSFLGGEKITEMKVAIFDSGRPLTQGEFQLIEKPVNFASSSTGRILDVRLALAARIVPLLGGQVHASDKSSRFEVQLPVRTSYRDPTLQVSMQTLQLGPRKRDRRRVLDDIRVLYVEDSRDLQQLVQGLLVRAGAREVALCNDGIECIEKLAVDDDFDLILLDIQLPRKDGYETIKALRKRGCKIPTIAVTAHSLRRERERCLEAGCDDYLSKPFTSEELIERIRLLLNQPQLTDSLASDSARHLEIDVEDLRRNYVAGLPAKVKKLATAFDNKNWADARAQCHTLSGSAGCFGCPEVGIAAGTVGQRLREENIPAAEGALAELQHIVANL